MRILNCELEHFGSYERLSFDYPEGLSLISGATGSGKSTLLDVAPWILFGVTAKNGAADDVRSWYADNCTIGTLTIELQSSIIRVRRIRGKASENDFYFMDESGVEIRGKDALDTQKLLSNRLGGIDAETYLSGAYFCQYSPQRGFFTSNAKQRRMLLEQIATLDLPMRLAEQSAAESKRIKGARAAREVKLSRIEGELAGANTQRLELTKASKAWFIKQSMRIDELELQAANFEAIKADKIKTAKSRVDSYEEMRVEKLTDLYRRLHVLQSATKETPIKAEAVAIPKCPMCGSTTKADMHVHAEQVRAYAEYESKCREIENYLITIDEKVKTENPYRGTLLDMEALENTSAQKACDLRAQEDPFIVQIVAVKDKQEGLKAQLEAAQIEVLGCTDQISKLDQIYDLSFVLRGELLKRSVKGIEKATNTFLEKHFDSEFRVKFTMEEEYLEVEIFKNGYECVFKQLSKGQQCLLTLTFSIAIMQAISNKTGVHFDNLFFDEALDGLDATLKIKAFALFESLSQDHSGVMLIDHAPEFQNLFSQQYYVSLKDDRSEIIMND